MKLHQTTSNRRMLLSEAAYNAHLVTNVPALNPSYSTRRLLAAGKEMVSTMTMDSFWVAGITRIDRQLLFNVAPKNVALDNGGFFVFHQFATTITLTSAWYTCTISDCEESNGRRVCGNERVASVDYIRIYKPSQMLSILFPSAEWPNLSKSQITSAVSLIHIHSISSLFFQARQPLTLLPNNFPR